MDSGNSGNLQSSSGGDEEYDSRAAAHSLFMPFDSPSHLRPIYTAPPPPLALFDPFSNYPQLHNPNAFPLNPNMPWPRPDPNPVIFQAPMAAVGENNVGHLGSAQNQNTAVRNPRKRPRASRRAPTTVLTTDTTNFRAMVQEFTGIPAPPFNTLSFPRSAAPPYLLRPSGQKPQSPPPFLVSSTAPFNYHLPITQNSNLFNVQNQNSFTSLLHSNPKFLFSNPDTITSKPHDQDSFGIPTTPSDNQLISLSHHESASPNGLPNLVSPDQIKDSNHDKNAETGNYPSEKRSQGMVETWISSSE